MDNGQHRVKAPGDLGVGRAQQMTLIYAVMVCVGMLILLQTLMLKVAVEGYLGEVDKVILPATVGSGLCFAASCWLIGYIIRMQGRRT